MACADGWNHNNLCFTCPAVIDLLSVWRVFKRSVKMSFDKKIVDIARRELMKMAAMTGTAGIIAVLGEKITPTLAAVAALQKKGGGAAPKADPVANDIAIANTVIQIEQKAVNTYLGLQKTQLITTKDYVDIANQFANDHIAHRDALIKAVTDLKGTPAGIKGLGSFPVPVPEISKKEVDAVRYALTLEVIASKIYFNAFKDQLKTKPGRDLILSILAVETQHVGVFRSLLTLKLKDKNIPDNAKLVPFPFLDELPTPAIPTGTTMDYEKLS